MRDKKIIYIDMDDTLCDYASAYQRIKKTETSVEYPQSLKGFYLGLEPLSDAIETYHWLAEQNRLSVYILTAPSIMNPLCYTEKRLWVEKWLGMEAVDRLIISPRKQLLKGDFLIDDKQAGRGQDIFEGKLIQFGSKAYPNWKIVRHYFAELSR